jgi:uncharacterized membrane protein
VAGFFWRRAGDGPAAPVPWPPLVLSLVCLAVLAGSGFLGGKLAFRYGVRVADEATQAEGYGSSAQPRTTAGSSRSRSTARR